jgi:hypothetical protein
MSPPSPRVARLHRALVKAIPRIPNDRASRDAVQQKSLASLLIDYFSWRGRSVGARPRTVEIDPAATSSPLWMRHRLGIEAFLEKVRRGHDLTPHLSLKAHADGYAPAASIDPAARWDDKDFVLNASNLHHFHVGTSTENRGHIARTDEILFAEVTRDQLRILGLFDHEAFTFGTAEHLRFLAAQERARPKAPPDVALIGTLLATSGHPVHVVNYAAHCARRIRDIDPLLDGRETLDDLYREAGQAPPDRTRPEWVLAHLDLVLFDRANNRAFGIAQGWN